MSSVTFAKMPVGNGLEWFEARYAELTELCLK